MPTSKNIYESPVQLERVTEVVTDNQSHQGPYTGSVDFAVPLLTPVLAAADGVVVRVRDDSEKYGEDMSFGQDVNYITIEHAGGELSEYLHLKKDSALVHVAEKVITGQKIAVTGLSGWLFAPHLHFMVYDASRQFQCKQIRFKHTLTGQSPAV